MNMPAVKRDSGFTLLELLIAMTLSFIIVGVVTTAFIITLKSTEQTKATLGESHDAQLVAAYLPSDLLSTGGNPTDVNSASGTSTGCAGSPGDNLNVVRLLWSDTLGGSAAYFAADYRVRLALNEWQLVRYACQASTSAGLNSTAASVLVVAHNLRPVVTSSDLPSATVSGDQLTLAVTDATGYRYTVTGTRRTPLAGATASATPSPTTSPPPEVAFVTAVEMYTKDAAGDVRIDATFSKNLDAGCASAFTVSGIGTRGTFSGTATVAGNKALLDLGTAPLANTTTTGISVHMAGDTASCTAGSFTTTTVTDKAAPVITNVATTVPGTVAGRIQQSDQLTLTFSEGLAAPPNLTTITEAGGGNNTADGLVLGGLFAGTASLGSEDYITSNNKDAEVPATTTASGSSLVITLGLYSCSGGQCPTLNPSGGSAGILTFTQADGLADVAGNALTATATANQGATASRTIANFRAF